MKKIDEFSLKASCVAFFVMLICLTRQFPFNLLSSLLSISLVLTLISQIYIAYVYRYFIKKNEILFLLIVAVLIGSYSLYKGNDPVLIVRFSFIVFIINFILVLNVKNRYYLPVFKYVYLFQSLVLIVIGITMPIIFDIVSYTPIRHLFQENNWGEIYTYNSFFYRIQVVGNALLPVFFSISYIGFREKSNSVYILLFSFLGCVFAGNLAFFLAVFIFIFVYEINALGRIGAHINKFKLFFTFIALSLTPVFIYYSIDLILMKSSGEGSSIGTRFDQASVLINSLSVDLPTLLFGTGIGHTLNVVTSIRDYTGQIYFELQFLYFLNQLGLIPFLLIMLVHLYFFLDRIKSFNCRLIYLIYLFYAATNPYFLDTSHVVVLILLISLNMKNSLVERINSIKE